MTGLGEHGARVATGVIDGLKTQPLSLALVVMNIVFVVFIWWLASTVNLRTEHQYQVKDELIARLLDQCAKGKQVIEEPPK